MEYTPYHNVRCKTSTHKSHASFDHLTIKVFTTVEGAVIVVDRVGLKIIPNIRAQFCSGGSELFTIALGEVQLPGKLIDTIHQCLAKHGEVVTGARSDQLNEETALRIFKLAKVLHWHYEGSSNLNRHALLCIRITYQ